MSVIVLDGHLKSALAVVRSLGAHGVPVYCGAERGSALACHSRYVTEKFVYPSPYTDPDGFIESVTSVAKKCTQPPVVYAMSEVTYLLLYEHRDELKDLMIQKYPPQISVETAFDKVATYGEAKVHGVPAMKTHLLSRPDEIRRLAETITYPAVVKPRRSVSWKDGAGFLDTASFVFNSADLIDRFNKLKEVSGENPLIQPLMKGEEYGVTVLAHEGEVFAEVVYHRVRSMSPTGGASVVKEIAEESNLTESMREYAGALTKELTWSGPIMFEFKVDDDVHRPHLMEINGRWVGSLPLATAAGLDLPWLYYQYMTTGNVPEHTMSAHPNTVTRHFLGDLRHLLRVFFKRDRMRAVLYSSRKMALRDFFSLPRGTKSDVWSFKDPMPSVWEYVDIITKLWK